MEGTHMASDSEGGWTKVRKRKDGNGGRNSISEEGMGKGRITSVTSSSSRPVKSRVRQPVTSDRRSQESASDRRSQITQSGASHIGHVQSVCRAAGGETGLQRLDRSTLLG
ncbi:hypothetical protein VNO78_17032 [Psophocarpus tetragonolobus]|uniref:Uncharacterized protein n=1 Tax=Psophocarpus tetragonolobus TaxID=3891 RepID=A0AAN9SIM2_PSOTE